jgi:hypothetical protein
MHDEPDRVASSYIVSEIRIISSGSVELVGPGMYHRLPVDIVDGSEDGILRLVLGSDPVVA